MCAILLGTSAEALEIELGKIFPGYLLIHNESAVKDDTSRILHSLSSPNAGLDIVPDIRGSSFQRKVWEALRTIPMGRPLTFNQLACRIPGSKSLRAIGQACADNPIALLPSRDRQQRVFVELSIQCPLQAISYQSRSGSSLSSTSLHDREVFGHIRRQKQQTECSRARQPLTFRACPLELKTKI